jgi:hypothetical protein
MEYGSFLEKVKAFAKLFYLPTSSPVPSLHALLKGDIRPGTLTGTQFKNIIDAYNKQPYGRLQYERELSNEIKNFVTGIRTWKLDPKRLLEQYVNSKRAESTEEKSKYSTWVRDNWKAPKWEIEKKKASVEKRINEIESEAERASKLFLELKKDGFRVVKHKTGDYSLKKE